MVVLLVGAIGLLFTLIRHGEASRVASLFFLTPPTTAVMAFLFFDERLAPVARPPASPPPRSASPS